MERPPRSPHTAASAYYSPDPNSPTFSPPGEYQEFQSLRPGTSSSFGGYSMHSDKYHRASTPQNLLNGNERSSTYYFNKEGGAAAVASGGAAYSYQGRRGQGYNPANTASLERGAAASKRPGFIRRRPVIFCLLILLILVGAGVGAGVGITMSRKSNNKNLAANSNAADTSSSSSASGAAASSSSNTNTNRGGTPTTTSAAAPTPTITPFPKWNWTDPNAKVYGANLGNWLVLERWLNEDWMVAQGGANAWDEWTFSQNLGSRAASVLQDHQNSWVTEAQMDTLQNAGINMIRIPIPFWAFIPTVAGEPFVTNGDYVAQLNKIMSWCYARGMYVALDLHAMPGSQNGDQSSGHNTTDLRWFTAANQARSDTFLENVLQWATTSNYSSIVSSVNVVNEPRGVGDDWTLDQSRFQTIQSYYERSYATCQKYNVPMTFHGGFIPNAMTVWAPFVSGKNPNMLIYENHPYPGWFSQPEPGASAIQTAVCAIGTASQTFGVPILMGEFSAINAVGSQTFSQTYLEMQYATYGQSAGSIFWNFKANPSTNPVLALAGNLMTLYSYLDILAAGYMPNPGKGGNVRSFYAGLPNPCGAYQSITYANPAP